MFWTQTFWPKMFLPGLFSKDGHFLADFFIKAFFMFWLSFSQKNEW